MKPIFYNQISYSFYGLWIFLILCTPLFSECVVGNCSSGYGSAIFSKGDSYSGNWRNGRAEGKGILKYVDGNRYSGDWKDGKADGQGTMNYADGTKYIGEWKSSVAHGKGTLFDVDGTILYSGIWDLGKMVSENSKKEKSVAQKEVKN
jgi:hypothetical protein